MQCFGLCRRRRLHQQVSEGAVIINVQVRTTAAKEADTTQLMETSIANGTFTKVCCSACPRLPDVRPAAKTLARRDRNGNCKIAYRYTDTQLLTWAMPSPQALQSSGLDAQAVRLSVVPTEGALPAPEGAPGVAAPGAAGGPAAVPVPSSGGSSNTGAIAGGVIGGLAFGLLLAAAVWFWLLRRRQRERAAKEAAGLAVGGKGDIESASDTGSSSGGGYSGSSGGGSHPSCWPFNRRGPKLRPGGDVGSAPPSADSPGGLYGSNAFLANGAEGSVKAERPLYGQVRIVGNDNCLTVQNCAEAAGMPAPLFFATQLSHKEMCHLDTLVISKQQVHAHARGGAAMPLGMPPRMTRATQQNGSASSLRDAGSVRDAYSMPGTPGGNSASGAGGTETPGG